MLRTNLHDLFENGQVGDWCFSEGESGYLKIYLQYPVPDEIWNKCYPGETENRGDVVMLPLSGEGHPVWQWDGNREAPTLSPSILVAGRWHGFLRAGKLITV